MQLTTKHQDSLDCFHALVSAGPQTLQAVYENIRDSGREGLALQFATKCLIFTANSDDDSITVDWEDCSSFNTPGWAAVHNHELWRTLIGSAFGSGWVTINQQGHRDGVVLSFNGVRPVVMLNVVDSAISISRVIDEQEAATNFSRRGPDSQDLAELLTGPEKGPVPPFAIPFPSPRGYSQRPREQAFRNPWSERVSEQPMPPITRKTGSVVRAIAYILLGGVCSAVVGALSYGIGYLISLGLGQGSLALRAATVINAIVPLSEWTGWGWIGAAVGTVVGLSVGAAGRKRVGLGLL